MPMSNTRHYTDDGLRELVDKLTDGERTLLRVGGALPKEKLGDLDPSLRSSDIARMIELLEDGDI